MLLFVKFYKSKVVMRGVENVPVRKILQIESGAADRVAKDQFYSVPYLEHYMGLLTYI